MEDLPASTSESNGGAASNDRRPAKSGPKSKSRTADEEDPSPAASLQQEPYTEARFQSDQKSLVGKWEVLGKDMEIVQALFAKDTIEKIRKTKAEFLRLAREADSLAESGNAAAREISRRARDGIKRIDPLESVWSRLDSRYERLQFQFRSARNLWESQPRWSLDLPQGDQEAAQDRLAFLGQAIDLTSKSASRLRDEKPEKTSQGIGEVETAALQLRREIEKAREVSRRATLGGSGSATKSSGSAGQSPPEGDEETRMARVPAPASPNRSHLQAPKKSAEKDLHPENEVRDEAAQQATLQEGAAPEKAGGSWTLVAVLCTLLAATLCALVYVLTNRRNGSQDGK